MCSKSKNCNWMRNYNLLVWNVGKNCSFPQFNVGVKIPLIAFGISNIERGCGGNFQGNTSTVVAFSEMRLFLEIRSLEFHEFGTQIL